MEEFEDLLKLCKKSGYKEGEDICEFWFANQKVLNEKLYGPKASSATPGYILRWKSEFGKAYEKAIREYIKDKVEANWNNLNAIDHKKPQITYTYIDFTKFRFTHSGKEYHPDELPNLYFKKHMWPDFDLSGIDLSGISLRFCIIRQCSLTSARFDNAYLWQVTFEGCCLNCSTFRNAQLIGVNLPNTRFISIDLTNASLSSINKLSDSTLFIPFTYKKIGYVELLRKTIYSLFNQREINKKRNHTYFDGNDISEINNPQLKSIKEYISWYQLVNTNTSLLKKKPLQHKLLFIIEIISTKYWSSFSALAFFALSFDLFMSTIIFFAKKSFSNIGNSFFDSFYFSTITFTNFGDGGVIPVDVYGKSIVLIESIFGYIVLGLFILLISKKVDKGF